jgi:hypothetical protein
MAIAVPQFCPYLVDIPPVSSAGRPLAHILRQCHGKFMGQLESQPPESTRVTKYPVWLRQCFQVYGLLGERLPSPRSV